MKNVMVRDTQLELKQTKDQLEMVTDQVKQVY